MEELTLREFSKRISDYGIRSFSLDWKDQSQPIIKLSGLSFDLNFTNNLVLTKSGNDSFNITFEIVGGGGTFTVSNITRITWEDVNDRDSIIRLYFADTKRLPVLILATACI